jgi:hypothetical protein
VLLLLPSLFVVSERFGCATATMDNAIAHEQIVLRWRQDGSHLPTATSVEQCERLRDPTRLMAVCRSCVATGVTCTGDAAKPHRLGDPG